MSRILSIDYGKKRTGIAVTDPLQIIATALKTVETKTFFEFLDNYLKNEVVEEIVIGHPKHTNNKDADIMSEIRQFAKKINNKYPEIKTAFYDERYTSKMAASVMYQAGYKKKDRRKKENLDKISAAILLQDYLEYKQNNEKIVEKQWKNG